VRCIFCYQKPIIRINSRTQAIKGLISYYKTNEIISLKNVWMQTTVLMQKCLKKKKNFLLKGNAKRQPTKKRTIIFGG
jgi:hypothetical protein